MNFCTLDCPWLIDGKDVDCLELKLKVSYDPYLLSRMMVPKI